MLSPSLPRGHHPHSHTTSSSLSGQDHDQYHNFNMESLLEGIISENPSSVPISTNQSRISLTATTVSSPSSSSSELTSMSKHHHQHHPPPHYGQQQQQPLQVWGGSGSGSSSAGSSYSMDPPGSSSSSPTFLAGYGQQQQQQQSRMVGVIGGDRNQSSQFKVSPAVGTTTSSSSSINNDVRSSSSTPCNPKSSGSMNNSSSLGSGLNNLIWGLNQNNHHKNNNSNSNNSESARISSMNTSVMNQQGQLQQQHQSYPQPDYIQKEVSAAAPLSPIPSGKYHPQLASCPDLSHNLNYQYDQMQQQQQQQVVHLQQPLMVYHGDQQGHVESMRARAMSFPGKVLNDPMPAMRSRAMTSPSPQKLGQRMSPPFSGYGGHPVQQHQHQHADSRQDEYYNLRPPHHKHPEHHVDGSHHFHHLPPQDNNVMDHPHGFPVVMRASHENDGTPYPPVMQPAAHYPYQQHPHPPPPHATHAHAPVPFPPVVPAGTQMLVLPPGGNPAYYTSGYYYPHAILPGNGAPSSAPVPHNAVPHSSSPPHHHVHGSTTPPSSLTPTNRNSTSRKSTKYKTSPPYDAHLSENNPSPRPPLSELLGHVRRLSRDQIGCRMLQQSLDEDHGAATAIFTEILPITAEVMVDPFGNYLFQKLLEKLSREERWMMVRNASNRLVHASLNLHGTRSVQKIVDIASMEANSIKSTDTPEDIQKSQSLAKIVSRALHPACAKLCIDSHGNHVIQRVLSGFPSDYKKFVFESVAKNVGDVARHRHGCCVIQRCLDSVVLSPDNMEIITNPKPPRRSKGASNNAGNGGVSILSGPKNQDADHVISHARSLLISKIISVALELMQDAYGNYVVQYLLDSCIAEFPPSNSTHIIDSICRTALGRISALSIQKFSSNVIEKCLERCSPSMQELYLTELSESDTIRELLQDPFGNYVIQKALNVATHVQALKLVDGMKPHLVGMKNAHNNAGGRRIVSKICRRFPDFSLEEEDEEDGEEQQVLISE